VPKFGAGGLAPTFKNNFAIPIECNNCCVRREHSATCIDKGSQSNTGMWEAAMTWPFLLAGGRAVTDASSPLAMECTVVPLATQTPIVGAVAS